MRILAAFPLLLLLSGCGRATVYQYEIEKANQLCSTHDGVKYIEATGIRPIDVIGRVYAKCMDGTEVAQYYDEKIK